MVCKGTDETRRMGTTAQKRKGGDDDGLPNHDGLTGMCVPSYEKPARPSRSFSNISQRLIELDLTCELSLNSLGQLRSFNHAVHWGLSCEHGVEVGDILCIVVSIC